MMDLFGSFSRTAVGSFDAVESMDFVEGSYDAAGPAASGLDVPDEQSVKDAIERIEPFLKGQGYLPMGGNLQVLNATAEQACLVLDLIFRLASQQQRDNRSREQLRDQADKDRVALAHAQKKNEALDESNRKLLAQVKDLEGKLLAAKHKAEEQERELKQKLQSTTARLNGYLHGGRDAGKRTLAGAGGAGIAAGAGGPRRVAPAYDRFKDDPAEAAAATQKLEAELAQLKQQNARLKKQLATAREQVGASPRTIEAGGSPVRDGQRGDQLTERGGMDSDTFDMQTVRNSLADAGGGALSSGEVARLQKLVRELQLNLEQQQRQLEKAAADRSELHRTLSSLRSKCATLEVERKNAEDRFLRAQRATAAMLDPAVAEAQSAELRAKLDIAERELHEANSRADLLKERVAAAEIELESNQRHVGVLKRAIRALPKGQQALEQLDHLVAEELQPLRDQLRSLRAELEAAKEQRSVSPRNEEPSCAGAVAAAPTQAIGSFPNRMPSEGLPLSPAVPHPSSPTARFDGFKTRPSPSADSPSLIMQPPPVHAFYNRTYSSTMPTERPSSRGDAADPQQELRPQSELTGMADASSPGAQNGSVSGANVGGVGGGAFMRRSVSAGVAHRAGEAYVSAERQRARWQVHNPMARQRFPSPIDIILEQARNPTAADSTISIRTAIPEGHTGVSSQGSTP